MKCRHCGAELSLPLADLGTAPPSNCYLTEKTIREPEKWFPLRVLVCESCWLVQTEDFARADELFDSEYAYFSGFSSTWLEHCERYAADMVERFGLVPGCHVVEIAANDGSLLRYFLARGINCTGVEPTPATAAAARAKGIPVIEDFFGVRLAEEMVREGKQADLVAANNVLAHVPEINDFVAGFRLLLAPSGVATFEFPHLLNLIGQNQFDTIYHEHFSYLSFTAAHRILEANGLRIFDVEQLPTHGGSLRLFAQRADSGSRPTSPAVAGLLRSEAGAGLTEAGYYRDFQARTESARNDLVRFLLDARREGKTVAGYGAAAKGNTLINYAGVRRDLIAFVADRNPAKQGKYLPGSRIPIVDERRLCQSRPDYILILPWNLKSEVMQQLKYVRNWGGTFVTAIPELRLA